VKGCCCQFPVEIEGEQVDECVDVGHTTPWCYTDPSVSPACGEEPESVSVFGHTRVNYTIFTPASLGKGNKDHRVEPGASRWWDHCTAPTVETHMGCQCKFPFVYKGKEHNICIWDDNDTPWCPTTDESCGAGLYKEKGGDGSVHRWDQCVGLDYEKTTVRPRQRYHPPPKFVPLESGRYCGDENSHWISPWHFKYMCKSEVCNYRCKSPLYCPTCGDDNCQCIEPQPAGKPCGDGTNRPPWFSHAECLSGKCEYDCLVCSNCNGGNCKCA